LFAGWVDSQFVAVSGLLTLLDWDKLRMSFCLSIWLLGGFNLILRFEDVELIELFIQAFHVPLCCETESRSLSFIEEEGLVFRVAALLRLPLIVIERLS
jgi:hypothetical protein